MTLLMASFRIYWENYLSLELDCPEQRKELEKY